MCAGTLDVAGPRTTRCSTRGCARGMAPVLFRGPGRHLRMLFRMDIDIRCCEHLKYIYCDVL